VENETVDHFKYNNITIIICIAPNQQHCSQVLDIHVRILVNIG